MWRLKRVPGVLLILILSSCAVQPPPAHPAEAKTVPTVPDPQQALPVDPLVITGELENGIRYFIRVNEKPEVRAELRLVINAGSVLEDDDQQGLAHLAEHMAFNGTQHFEKQELVDYLESIGMRFGPDLNAYTSFDETVYMLKVPTDSLEMVEQAFQILEDWAHGISFEGEEIDKERGVVIEEWRLGRGAEARMRDKQFPILFKESQYAVRLPIGQKTVLDTFQHESIRRFYADWYRPELMAVVAVGDFDPLWIEGLIRSHFGSLETQTNVRERTLFPVPDHEETLVAIASDPEATNSRVGIYFKQDVKDESTHGAYRNLIIRNLYNGMLNKRLDELTKKPDAPYLFGYSGQGRFIRTKEFFFLGAMVKDNGIERGLKALMVEAERAARHGFTNSELEREKKDALRRMEKAYEEREKTDSRRYAGEYIRHFLGGEPIPGIPYELDLYNAYLPEIGIDEVNRLTREWITEGNRVIMANLPEKEGARIPDKDSLLAIFEAVKGLAIDPYEDAVSDQPLVAVLPVASDITEEGKIDTLGITEWTLANGVKIVIKPTDFKNDEILFSAVSKGGHSLIPDESHVSGEEASSIIWESGVGGFNRIDLDKRLAGKIVHISPTIGELQEGFTGSASPKDVETLFQLIYLYFTSPRKDTTAFLAYKEKMKGFLENRSASPRAAFSDTLQVTMAQYHHRARPLSLALLEEMDLEIAYNFYKDRFADASDFTFFFVGNIDLETIRPLVQTYLGGLPVLNRNESWRDIGMDPPEGIIIKEVRKGMEPQSLTRIVFTGPFEWSVQNRYEMTAVARALRIKLREVLREDLGGTYGVRINAGTPHYPDERYRITISFGSDPERAEELTREVFTQIDSLKMFGTTEKYLQKVKETQRRERETSLKNNRFWLNTMQYFAFNNVDILEVLQYEDRVEGLSLEAIQHAAQAYFNTENYVQVVLLPEGFGQP